jgi:hypothetical protein
MVTNANRTAEFGARLRISFHVPNKEYKGLKFSITCNPALDAEVIQAGTTFSGIHVKSGTRKFEDYAKARLADISPEIKPCLKQFYSAARFKPGFDATGMTSHDDVDIADVEKIIEGIKLN